MDCVAVTLKISGSENAKYFTKKSVEHQSLLRHGVSKHKRPDDFQILIIIIPHDDV